MENLNSVSIVSLESPLPIIPQKDLKFAESIGQGGYGIVYRGTWQNTIVAIKKLHLQKMDDELLEDFKREAQFMGRCQFPNIVRLWGVCLEPGHYAMVMEYLPKGSLYEVLRDRKELLPWSPTRWQIALDIGAGLNYLHNQKITHRDLKSLNILLDTEYRAKICDFGLAKIKLETNATITFNKKTSTGRWSAPEILQENPYTFSADIYSYGIILWEIATRKLPFAEITNEFQVGFSVLQGKRDNIPLDCPTAYKDVIEACWAQEPTKRLTAREAIARLEKSKPIFRKKPPSEYYCPITQELMYEPVVVQDGHSYERQAIEKHLQTKHTSPITGSKLTDVSLRPNYILKSQIHDWLQANPQVPDTELIDRLCNQKERGEMWEKDADEIIKKCLWLGAKIDVVDSQGFTALHWATYYGETALVASLLQRCSKLLQEVNQQQESPLHIACKKGREEIVKLFLQYPVNLELKNQAGKTPGDYAKEKEHRSIVRLLNTNVNSSTMVNPPVVKWVSNLDLNYSQFTIGCDNRYPSLRERVKNAENLNAHKPKANYVAAKIGVFYQLTQEDKTIYDFNSFDIDDKSEEYLHVTNQYLNSDEFVQDLERYHPDKRDKIREYHKTKNPIFYQWFHHSERGLFKHLETPQVVTHYFQNFASELKGKQGVVPPQIKIEMLVLEIHSSHYLCNWCEKALQYFQSEKSTFSTLIKNVLEQTGFEISRDFYIMTRYTAEKPTGNHPIQTKNKHEPSHQPIDVHMCQQKHVPLILQRDDMQILGEFKPISIAPSSNPNSLKTMTTGEVKKNKLETSPSSMQNKKLKLEMPTDAIMDDNNNNNSSSSIQSLMPFFSIDPSARIDYIEGMQYFESTQYCKALPCFEKAAEKKYPPAYLRLGWLYAEGGYIGLANKAKSAYWYKYAASAIDWFKQESQKNEAEALYNLGECYYYGIGVEQEYKQAVQYYQRAVDQGYALAQNDLGFCYWQGHGVSRINKRAFVLYELAAKQKLAAAQYNLGQCYKSGRGVARSYVKAFNCYKLAAEQGDAEAQYQLANCYSKRRGVKKDYTQTAHYLKLAADQGHAKAQYNLGVCYAYGEGVGKNLTKAVKYYQLAAEQEHAKAQFRLGVCYEDGKGVEKDLERAVTYYQLAVTHGCTDAQYNLGVCYENGTGVKKDLEKAVEYYRVVADQGEADAQYALGSCYEKGKGVKEDLAKAIEWYKLAADQEDADAQYALGLCYESGKGVEKNLEKAVEYYKAAANQKHIDAKCALGLCYEKGEGVKKDLEEAVTYYKEAATYEHPGAQYRLGLCYEKGRGVEKDLEQAVKYYQLAAEQRNADAQEKLESLLEYSKLKPIFFNRNLLFNATKQEQNNNNNVSSKLKHKK